MWITVAAPLAVWSAEAPLPMTESLPSRLTLAQCLNLVLQRNPDVMVAQKKLEEAAGGIVEARAGYLPGLTSSANYSRVEDSYMNQNGAIPDRRPELWNVAIRLTETVYSGGAVGGKMQIAKLTKASRLLDYESALDRVIMDTRIAFYEILQNKAEVAVHQQAVSFLEGEWMNQRNRLQVGAGDRLQMLRAQVSLSLERAALLESENRLRNSYVRMSELMSVPYAGARRARRDHKQLILSEPQPAAPGRAGDGEPPFEVEGELAYAKQPLDLNTCLARALELRSEMKVRENDIAAQKQQLVVDGSTFKPKVDAFVGYDVVNEPNAAASRNYYSGYMVGVAATWQIFDGWAARGKADATRARIAQAELTQESTRNAIQAEVVRAFHDLQQAEETIQTQQRNVALAEESLKLARTNVELGLTTQLELLQSRLDLTRAQTVELSARFAYNAALARLQRAMSSRFTILEEPPRPAAEHQP
ncbi:MAG: TolC family protein [Verrucomicrobia bacterium]|nr:TolC family protein [Verrucomicrobiota bacterium]